MTTVTVIISQVEWEVDEPEDAELLPSSFEEPVELEVDTEDLLEAVDDAFQSISKTKPNTP